MKTSLNLTLLLALITLFSSSILIGQTNRVKLECNCYEDETDTSKLLNQSSRTLFIYGKITSQDDESITVFSDKTLRNTKIPMECIQSYHVSKGKKGVFTLPGFILGGIAGGKIGNSFTEKEKGILLGIFPYEKRKSSANGIIGFVVGGVLGALAGNIIKIEKWKKVKGFKARLSLDPSSSISQVGLKANINF